MENYQKIEKIGEGTFPAFRRDTLLLPARIEAHLRRDIHVLNPSVPD